LSIWEPAKPNHGVVAVRVANLDERKRLIAGDPAKFFTEPHYDGLPAVLVRLKAVSGADLEALILEALITEAWRCQAPADLAKTAVHAKKKRPRRHR
jgi:hypothetical protein